MSNGKQCPHGSMPSFPPSPPSPDPAAPASRDESFFCSRSSPRVLLTPPFSVPPCSAGADGQEMEERRLEAVRGGAAEMGWTRGQIAAWLKCCTQRGQCVSLPRPHPQTTRGEIFIFPPVDEGKKPCKKQGAGIINFTMRLARRANWRCDLGVLRRHRTARSRWPG